MLINYLFTFFILSGCKTAREIWIGDEACEEDIMPQKAVNNSMADIADAIEVITSKKHSFKKIISSNRSFIRDNCCTQS